MSEEEQAVREERVTISRAALRLELLEMEVRLKDFWSVRFAKVESDVRELQAVNARRDAAEAALRLETERRRSELADSSLQRDRKFTKREKILVYVTGLLFGVAGLYISLHPPV